MFQIKIGKRNYKVEFKHYNPVITDKIPGELIGFGTLAKNRAGYIGGTVCAIGQLNKDGTPRARREIVYGYARLCRLDRYKFCRETGRKISLGRALGGLWKIAAPSDLSKFWIAYFETQDHSRRLALMEEFRVNEAPE